MFNKILKIASTIGATLRTGSIFNEDDVGLFLVKGFFLFIVLLVMFFLFSSKRGRKLIKTIRGNK